MPTLYEAVDLCDRAATVAVPASMVKSTSPSRTLVKRWRMNASSREIGSKPETRFRCEFWRTRYDVSSPEWFVASASSSPLRACSCLGGAVASGVDPGRRALTATVAEIVAEPYTPRMRRFDQTRTEPVPARQTRFTRLLGSPRGSRASPARSRTRFAKRIGSALCGLFGELLVAEAAGARDERRLEALLDRLLRDHALGDVLARGQLEHHVEQRVLDDRPEPAGPRLTVERLVRDRPERVLGEVEVDVVVVEEPLVLLRERVLRLGQDLHEVVALQLVDCAQHRQAADELRDQPEVQEVLRHDAGEQLGALRVALRRDLAAEADGVLADALRDDLVEAGERAAADEEDVRRVDREELLVRMLPPALRRHRRDGPLEDLQERLLDALARHVARDRRVVRLARDLVDLVDVDDPRLRLLDVEVGRLDQLQQDVLDVLADVAGLGQRRRVGDRERDVEDPRERLREVRLAAARRAEQHDVRLLQLDVAVLGAHADALVVVVDRHRQRPLRLLLRDDVLVQRRVDLHRARQVVEVERGRSRQLLVDDLVAEIDAFVADVDTWACDQLLDLPLRLPAEAAEKLFVSIARPGHPSPFTPKVGVRLALLDFPMRDHRVDDPIVLRLIGAHEEVALHVVRDLFGVLAGVPAVDLLEPALEADHLACLDLDVGSLTREPTRDLVDQDPRVRQRHALSLRAAGQQQRS